MKTGIIQLLLSLNTALAAGTSGYQFKEGHSHTTLSFHLYKNLIVIPARLNDTLQVQLILDTGARSLLLYGKRFANLANSITGKKIRVAGWGNGQAIQAATSFPNDLTLGDVQGTGLSVAIVPDRKLASDKPMIDGVIGYDLFARFAVVIDYQKKMIELYDQLPAHRRYGFSAVPMEVNQARPQVTSTLILGNHEHVALPLLVDTGSSLELTLFSTSKERFLLSDNDRVLGRGIAGIIRGFELFIEQVLLDNWIIQDVSANLVHIKNHPDPLFTVSGSLGGGFLKDHIVIFDYPGRQLWLKRFA